MDNPNKEEIKQARKESGLTQDQANWIKFNYYQDEMREAEEQRRLESLYYYDEGGFCDGFQRP